MMRTDDPRLEVGRKAMEERVNKYNALILAVIKGHLAIEQAIDSYLEVALFHPEHVRESRFNFSHKLQICRSMSLKQNEDRLWSVIWAANALRNEIAHDLQTEEIQNKADRLRRVYLEVLTPQQAESAKNAPDHQIAESACYLSAGFLASLGWDAKERRALLDKHWKPKS
jgi:hypothetical protein